MHRSALAALLLAVAVGIVGCAPEPSAAPTRSASPHPSASSTPDDDEAASPAADLAASAVVTASSEDTAGGHAAANAVDGDPATEWATVGGGVGSTILLELDGPQDIGSVTLSDRPGADHVEAGTLEFSDGSIAQVPSLPDDGTPVRIEFTPRSVSSVRFTVDAVGPETTDVGLTEIGTAAPEGLASVLGTERIFADADGVVLVRPHAVSTVDVTDGIRLIRVDLEIEGLAGLAQPRQYWFAMLGADDAVYDPVDDPADEDADPISDDAVVGEGEELTGTVHFEVPADGSGFVIGYAPEGDVLATWSLNAA